MKFRVFGVFLVALLILAGMSSPAVAQDGKPETLVDQVQRSIDRGVKYLRSQQRVNGSWEVNDEGAGIEGGWTTLALHALLNAGVPADDPAVQRGLKYVRALNPKFTYVIALQTMVFAEAGLAEDRERIAGNVKWLVQNRVVQHRPNNQDKFIGWTYTAGMRNTADGSNTQYAVMGLAAGKQGGAAAGGETWQGLRNFYVGTQTQDGYWRYSDKGDPVPDSSLTMTQGGICGLILARRELKDGGGDKALERGLRWLSDPVNFKIVIPQATFYNLHGLARVGRLSGHRFLGVHDWYQRGADYLVKGQRADGSWSDQGVWDKWPVVSTSFALLFLGQGSTPVLISKVVHGMRDKQGFPTDNDWNRAPNDLHYLTTFASARLFKGRPLAWQSFDLRRALKGKTAKDIADAAAQLLPSPVALLSGRADLPFTEAEKNVLKLYVENGGLLLVEGVGAEDFDKSFKALVAELWPKSPLEKLGPKHAVWKAKFSVAPGKFGELMGVQVGGKTRVLYSTRPLAPHWDSNRLDNAEVRQAFELAANVIHYATDGKMPPPRGTLSKVTMEP